MGVICKNVKVVSCYLGPRRSSGFFHDSLFQMLKSFWEKEQYVDHGVPMNTILIYNRISGKGNGDKCLYKDCENFLFDLSGKKTRNGECLVIPRENIGISFGAFDFAFHHFRSLYNYWLFVEDDQIIIKDGVMKQCIEQMAKNSHDGCRCGFVSLCGIDDGKEDPPTLWPLHAYGACGCTSRFILDEVFKDNFINGLGRTGLPNVCDANADMGDHSEHGEIKFTNDIFKYGYSVERIEMDKVVCGWGNGSLVRNRHYESFAESFPSIRIIDRISQPETYFEIIDDKSMFPKYHFRAVRLYYDEKAVKVVFKNLKDDSVLYSCDFLLNISNAGYWATLYVDVRVCDEIGVEALFEGKCFLRERYTFNKDNIKMDKVSIEYDFPDNVCKIEAEETQGL